MRDARRRARGARQRGRPVRQRQRCGGAALELADARRSLSRAASPMAAWALLFTARAQIRQLARFRADVAQRRFAIPLRRSTSCFAAAAQYQGFLYDARSDYVHMVAAYDSAVAENRTTREPQITLRVGVMVSPTRNGLRGREAGWRTQYAALAASPRYPRRLRCHRCSTTPGWPPRRSSALSLRYCDESVRSRGGCPIRRRLAYALRRRADLLGRMGETDLARADIDTALGAVKRVANADE